MARGNSSRAASEQGNNPFKDSLPQKTEEGYRAELIEHFNNLITDGMEPTDLKNIPPPDLQVIAANVSNASDEARGQRDEFDRIVEKAEGAMNENTPFRGATKEQIAEFIPLTFSEVQEGLTQRDVLDRYWKADDIEDGLQAAVERDRQYGRDDDGSFAESFMSRWANGFIQARLDSASADRDDYDDEINTVEAQELEDQVSSWIEES